MCLGVRFVGGKKQIISLASLWRLSSGRVRCLPKVFHELVADSGQEVANLASECDVLLPSNHYKCDKLSY